ncbi:MAG: hypothetical protein JXR78_14155 [Victivallales bacterium]|nr:hypothetical protein [Victivallales bacterium]
MPAIAYFAVFSAVLLPAALYFYQAYKEQGNIKDISDFFPLKRSISSGEYRSTTVAAGMSLATVIISLLNLSPLMGITLMVSVVSYALSFLILYPCVNKIMTANPDNDTIQTFLGKAYKSPAVRHSALIFSLIGYLSIFSMELLVGVTVLEPFLGEKVLFFSFIYLIFIIIYSLMSGYRAIIITDKWQLRFIILSLASLLLFAILETSNSASDIHLPEIFRQISHSWVPVWPFIIGIVCMNLPAPISDPGTWQRLCSTRKPTEAKRGLLQIAPLFAVLWAVIVLFGCYYGRIAQINNNFDPASQSLISATLTTLSTNGILYIILLTAFVLGMFSAMISTADSLLIITGQIIAIDFMGLKKDQVDCNDGGILKRARIAMLFIAIISFVIFTIFKLIKFDVVQLVFAIYGAQLAMFPSVVVALFLGKKINISKARVAATLSVFSGFVAGWSSALYGKLTGSSNWLYNAPVSALVVSFIPFIVFFAIKFISRKDKRRKDDR